jgi:catechol 2,3-dioxygenase-like lactoylglutathione lyase family enzyme
MEYHHVGIPTTERRPGERHLPELGLWVSGYDESEFGIEWMRFEPASPVPELVRRVPHVAFRVPDRDSGRAAPGGRIFERAPVRGLSLRVMRSWLDEKARA